MAAYARLLKVALGEAPADLVIRNVTLLNTVTRDAYPATIGICEDTIAYVTTPDDANTLAARVIDGTGMWAAPGLIDSHMHVESTHVTPAYFADAVLPHGVTTVAQDPHEMANVLGAEGVAYMRDAAAGLPLRVLTFVPTCVPAVPGLETAGAHFGPGEIEALLDGPNTIGLAEVMDYWGVIRQSERTSQIVQAGLRSGKIITGHIRGLAGRELNTYLAAGVDSDHEVLTAEGIRYRSRLGMTLEICCSQHRDNIPQAVESWKERGHLENVVFVTDDVPPNELVHSGHLDRGVRRAIALGMAPVDAVRAASLAPARRLRRHDLGQIAPGRTADLLLLEDLDTFSIHTVITGGRVVAQQGRVLQPSRSEVAVPAAARDSVRIPDPRPEDFVLRAPGSAVTAFILTQRARGPLEQAQLAVAGGAVQWQQRSDLALAAVIHRHGQNHNRSLALLAGCGLHAGAIATTYAHDSHNLVVLGRDPADMVLAAKVLKEVGGGYVAVSGGVVRAMAALPVAGLLAEQPVEDLARAFDAYTAAAADLGVTENPIGLLSSLPLPVVPSYRPTDIGLVDVNAQKLIPAFVWHE